MAPSVFGDTFGRPSFFPCWRTRSRPARTLLRMICRSCSPNTDAIWIMARPHQRGAVDGLLVGIECNASSIEFRQGVYEVQQAAPQPVMDHTIRTSNSRRTASLSIVSNAGR